MTRVEASSGGLTSTEAAARLESYGPNEIPEAPPEPFWKIILSQFTSPLVYIMVLAAGVSALAHDWKDTGFIVIVLIINTAIGAYHERKAQINTLALKHLLRFHSIVQRDGIRQTLASRELVPGDIVFLESGNRVPADLRLLTTHELAVDESMLTGESLPVEKEASWTGEPTTPLGDRANMAYAGSTISRGRSRGIVVATGASTIVGQLATDVSQTSSGKPPLLERMERFTNTIAIATVVLSSLVGLIGVLVGRHAISDMFLFVVALAVAAIPEGLPVAMTIALAVASTRMAKRGVIVRHLTAVEGLGSCTLIATDKTGTLTVNELTVTKLVLANGRRLSVTGEGFIPVGDVIEENRRVRTEDDPYLHRLARAAVLCNEAELRQHEREWIWRGDAVDLSMLVLGEKLGISRSTLLREAPLLSQIPFESESQFSASLHRVDEQRCLMIKGAPERILSLTSQAYEREFLESEALAMARSGLRVLALAELTLTDDDSMPTEGGPESLNPLQNKLIPLGLVGTIDPLRPGVKEAIQQCHQAGVAVTMVTGDHRITAFAIARELGFASSEKEVLTGTDVEHLSLEELASKARTTRVFARVTPRQKLRIVEAARHSGEFVAVTGDGVNDAPALRAANIGVAMGKGGTDVAREAAELVISDDNFTTIVAGIEEGRIAYDNIRKVIYLLISTGTGELVLMCLAVLTNLPLPLLPVQLLWLNLVTNGIQDVALAVEPGEGDSLKRPPRPPKQRIFDRLMIERLIVAALLMGTLGFGAFAWMIHQGWSESSARNILLLMMVLFENFHIGNCRSETKSAFSISPLRSPALLAGASLALLIHISVMYLPWMQTILGTEPVSGTTWVFIGLLAFSIVPAIEAHKILWRFRVTKTVSTHSASTTL